MAMLELGFALLHIGLTHIELGGCSRWRQKGDAGKDHAERK